MKQLLKSLTLVLILSVTPIGCFEDTGSYPGTISDETFYEQIAAGIIFCIAEMYNQNLAGKPTGEQNISTSGPLGGSVTITGTTGLDQTHDITTIDLSYDMAAVRCIQTDEQGGDEWVTNLTLTGTVTDKGSFSDTFHSTSIQSNLLRILVSSSRNGEVLRTLDETGPISINYQTNSVSANIFGHTVAWSW